MLFAEVKYIEFNSGIMSKEEAESLVLNDEYFLPLSIGIGIKNEDGADLFELDVLNIGWVKRNRFVILQNSMVVDLNTLEEIESLVIRIVSSISGKSWIDIVEKLKCIFKWEYEGHQFLSISP